MTTQQNSSAAISLAYFTWDTKTGTLSGEASTVWGGRHFGIPQDVRVRSHHTGAVERFTYVGKDVDLEGDVRAWKFNNVRANGKARKLVVFND